MTEANSKVIASAMQKKNQRLNGALSYLLLELG